MERIFIKDVTQMGLPKERIVACIGFFDGIHLGHQLLIDKTKERAKALGVKSALITFNPDPWTVINKKNNVKHITPLKRKLDLIEKYGIDETLVINFNSAFSSQDPDTFVNQVLLGLGVEELIVGSDFKFGKRGAGTPQLLVDEYNQLLTTHIVDLKFINDIKVGSTSITQTTLQGKVDITKELLGRYYSISGFVIDGAKQGRKIGFPTANIEVVDEYVMPKVGVYMGYTKVDNRIFKSIINIGYNPTFNTRDKVMIETHLLDFDEFIYGQVIHQYFVKRIRDELKFDSVEALIEQMKQDEQDARDFLEDVDELL